MADEAVKILSGENVELTVCKENVYIWREADFRIKMTLEFEKIYELEHVDWDYGIKNCVYSVNGRNFKDLNCMRGHVIKKFPMTRDDCGYELRKYSDGKKFLFYWEDIPTFDDGDREWDSMKYRAVFCDENGVNVIHCHEGYKLPRIRICIGMKKVSAEFLRWLVYIGCPYDKFPEKI